MTVTDGAATYALLAGKPLPLMHHGTEFELADAPVVLELPEPVRVPPVKHPEGRAPLRRRDVP